ncbi:hypothetical protein CTAYLR_010606 [Chrysophaeum taylorii]|uniref:peptidylprolyl isomerase n=1 Tax=Chrysophaeum taylorii TaxID=2483200 RepID=A0AAD7UHB2_9STRA|nr:hypothetical protein CTAYLR_010606 [Chrysophaeum taylorii]
MRPLFLGFATVLLQLPKGWEDLSGDGRCLKRRIVAGNESEAFPRHGAVCEVRWTAWLAEGYPPKRGERVGMLQPKASFEFTLGGGEGEATIAWDLAVKTMRVGEVCEVFAGHEYAFGTRGAEPHVPPKAALLFELELDRWTDFATDYETVYGLQEAENDQDDRLLRDELERLAEANNTENSLLSDVAEKIQEETTTKEDHHPRRPVFGDLSKSAPVPVEGKGEGYSWTETADEMYLRVEAPAPILSRDDVQIRLTPTTLALSYKGRELLAGALEGTIAVDESTWAVAEDRHAVDVYLAKKRTTTAPKSLGDIWASVLRGRVS